MQKLLHGKNYLRNFFKPINHQCPKRHRFERTLFRKSAHKSRNLHNEIFSNRTERDREEIRFQVHDFLVRALHRR